MNNPINSPPLEARYDEVRLTTQRERIFELVKGGAWFTLGSISALASAPEASVSACLRSFRADKHGGHTVNRRRRGDPSNGLWEYQLIVKPKPPEQLGLGL